MTRFILLMLLSNAALAGSQTAVPSAPSAPHTLEDGQRLFYSGGYQEAAAIALTLRTANPTNLAAYELRTSALHFQIKREMGDAADKGSALENCIPCKDLMAHFQEDKVKGTTAARAVLQAHPDDMVALFYLGKIDLNHVWLHLGTLGRRTAFSEYREARRTLDIVLKRDPSHVRARVARAWMEYIVDTKVPFGFQWILGGGDRKKALVTVREAAVVPTDFFGHAEARFALWEMLIREQRFDEAVEIARGLATEFPTNTELERFLKTRGKAN